MEEYWEEEFDDELEYSDYNDNLEKICKEILQLPSDETIRRSIRGSDSPIECKKKRSRDLTYKEGFAIAGFLAAGYTGVATSKYLTNKIHENDIGKESVQYWAHDSLILGTVFLVVGGILTARYVMNHLFKRDR